MALETAGFTRKQFLMTLGGAALMTKRMPAQTPKGKLLIFVAHPDDEYAFAAATYRLVRESGWIADQITITDGESGYRYAALAETYYNLALTKDGNARQRLPAIRKEEALRAGKVLGIREHRFLDQKDLGFDTDAASAGSDNWDRGLIRRVLAERLERERYDAIFALLPTAETHGHHRAATLLVLETVAGLPEASRPLVFGVEPRGKEDRPLSFAGLPDHPVTQTVDPAPTLVFDRSTAFGYHSALNYQIVVNWLIAEHKSQGMFQNDYGRHQFEEFWLFQVSGKVSDARLARLRSLLSGPPRRAAAG